MKEQWKFNSEKFLEEAGLQQDEQKCAKKMREQGGYSENGCCNRWTRYIKLIIYLELALFLGWSCFYMIAQTYRFQEMENDGETVVRERLMQSTIAPNTEMPVMFVKPEVFLSKLNDLLENTELIKGQDLTQDNTIATDAAVRTSKSDLVAAQSDNKMQANGVDSLLSQLLPPTAESFHDERSTMLETDHLGDPMKDVVSINRENEESTYFNRFLGKLRDTSTKESGILESSVENTSDLLDSIIPLIFDNHENLENNVAVGLRDFGASATNNLGESTHIWIPKLAENTAQDDRSERSDDYDENNERVFASFESKLRDLDSDRTFFDMSWRYEPPWSMPSWSQQSERRIVETSEQINDEKSDTPSADAAARNENKYGIEDSVVSTPASPDAIAPNHLGESIHISIPKLTENTAQDDRSERSDDYDENNERDFASFEARLRDLDSDRTFFDIFWRYEPPWSMPSWSQQSKRRIVETSEQINDEESDTPSADAAARNENKYGIEDSVVSTPASPDAIAPKNNDDLHSSFDKLIALMRNVENRYSPKIVKDSKEENPQKNPHRLPLSHDDIANFSTPTLKFQWYSPPAQFANDQPDDQIEIVFNTNLISLENFRQIFEFNFLTKCQWDSEGDDIKIKCFFNAPADEEKDLPYLEKHTSNIPKVTDHSDISFDYADYYDDDDIFM